jgi:hypothetical protein
MEEAFPIKLTSPSTYSKKKSELTLFSNKMKCLMFWESPKVKDSKVLSKDLELNISKRNHIEVIEKLVVSEPGILLELDGPSLELVTSVITIELK